MTQRRKDAFTLLELVFTLSIFCFLLAAGGFFFRRGIAHSALETASSVLHSDMILMKSRASAENNAHILKFYGDHYFFGPQNEALEKRALTRGVGISGTTFSRKIPGKDTVLIYPSGAPLPGGTVTLQNSFGEKKYVIISVAIGRIRISDTPP